MSCCIPCDEMCINYTDDLNECCVTNNLKLYNKYDVLLKKQKQYEMNLLINCCFLLSLIINKFKFPKKKLYKPKKIFINFIDTVVYF